VNCIVRAMVFSALARWRCGVAIFHNTKNKTYLAIVYSLKSITTNFHLNRLKSRFLPLTSGISVSTRPFIRTYLGGKTSIILLVLTIVLN